MVSLTELLVKSFQDPGVTALDIQVSDLGVRRLAVVAQQNGGRFGNISPSSAWAFGIELLCEMSGIPVTTVYH